MSIMASQINLRGDPTLNNGCEYLSILGLKLIHVSKRAAQVGAVVLCLGDN